MVAMNKTRERKTMENTILTEQGTRYPTIYLGQYAKLTWHAAFAKNVQVPKSHNPKKSQWVCWMWLRQGADGAKTHTQSGILVFSMQSLNFWYNIQWIGLRENLQETMVFTIKYRVFLQIFPSSNSMKYGSTMFITYLLIAFFLGTSSPDHVIGFHPMRTTALTTWLWAIMLRFDAMETGHLTHAVVGWTSTPLVAWYPRLPLILGPGCDIIILYIYMHIYIYAYIYTLYISIIYIYR